MEKQKLMEGEDILIQSNNDSVILTSRRLLQNSSSFGKSYQVSVHLKNISSTEMYYKSHLVFLVAGVLVAVAGAVIGSSMNEILAPALALAALLILIYFLTRRHLIRVSSDGGAKINILIKRMKKEVVLDFINKMEQAKNNLN